MIIPAEFQDIRPYEPEELPAVYDELVADPKFKEVIQKAFPEVAFEQFTQKLHACHSSKDFQLAFMYPVLKQLMEKATEGVDMNAENLSTTQNYTFVSNHRDIVIDSAFLSVLLVDNHFPTTVEIAIGDNLLVYPWIKKLVRINKSFIVKRSASMREVLTSSMLLSKYIHFAIAEKKENIWIAQREGRAKDSDDRTQDAVLKMLAMGGSGDIIDRLAQLHIVPLAISYEYDPCDYLKAREFQQKRDEANYKKTPQDDLLNMQTGIWGYKGHVHYHAAPPLNDWLSHLDHKMPKTELFSLVAKHMDEEIHRNYRLYPINYIALDLLENATRFKHMYTADEQERVKQYLEDRLAHIQLEYPDTSFLREKLLNMYANPTRNKLKAMASE